MSDPVLDELGMHMSNRMVDRATVAGAGVYHLRGEFKILQADGMVWVTTIVAVSEMQPIATIPKEWSKEGA